MAVLTGIPEIDQEGCLELFKFGCKAESNVLVLGPAGGGKTAMAQQAAKETGYEAIYIDLSVLESPDFVGLPTISKTENGGKVVEYATPKFMPCSDIVDTSKKKYVLIFDEIDKSRPELQAPLLEIFHERTINGRPLHVGGILATGNLPDEGAFSQPISHALTNRCSVFKMSLGFPAWQQWATRNGVNPLITGFLSRNPDQLLQPPPDGDPTAYCHPSPRAWTNASRDLVALGDSANNVMESTIVSGRVGVGSAAKFQVWLDYYREIGPMIDKLVEDGTHPPDLDIGKQIVCAISACNQIRVAAQTEESAATKAGRKVNKKKVSDVCGYVMTWLLTLSSEYQIAGIRNSLDMDLIKKWDLMESPNFIEVFSNTCDVMHR